MECTQEDLWYSAGVKALEYIPSDAEIVAFGAGRTVQQALKAFYDREMHVSRRVVCGSIGTEEYARSLGINVMRVEDFFYEFPVYIDGADQIDMYNSLIKGGLKVNTDGSFTCVGDPGREGCMHREKKLANISRQFVVVADASKYVPFLGFNNYPLPIEFDPDKFLDVVIFLKNKFINTLPELRRRPDGSEFETENFIGGRKCQIFDINFNGVFAGDLKVLEKDLDSQEGIYSSGLFAIRKPDVVIIADPLVSGGIKVIE
ncbi:MAG: ribose-5-phosphate isomerase A [Candidatus Aenigmatarchaeota archaeon]